MVNVAPWQALAEALLIDAALVRSTTVVVFAGRLMVSGWLETTSLRAAAACRQAFQRRTLSKLPCSDARYKV